MSKTETIVIERRTPIPGEADVRVWVDGALARMEDFAEIRLQTAREQEDHQLLEKWIAYKWMYQLQRS